MRLSQRSIQERCFTKACVEEYQTWEGRSSFRGLAGRRTRLRLEDATGQIPGGGSEATDDEAEDENAPAAIASVPPFNGPKRTHSPQRGLVYTPPTTRRQPGARPARPTT
jgi:hypothetical protein